MGERADQATAQATAQAPAEFSEARWLRAARWCAVVVFVALPVFACFSQRLARRVVWTVVVASLPLFFVVVG